jgi:hypothetical protein
MGQHPDVSVMFPSLGSTPRQFPVCIQRQSPSRVPRIINELSEKSYRESHVGCHSFSRRSYSVARVCLLSGRIASHRFRVQWWQFTELHQYHRPIRGRNECSQIQSSCLLFDTYTRALAEAIRNLAHRRNCHHEATVTVHPIVGSGRR